MATVVDLFYGDTYMMIPCMEIKSVSTPCTENMASCI